MKYLLALLPLFYSNMALAILPINLIVENTVSAGVTDTVQSSIIPNGKTVRVQHFGGFVQGVLSDGMIALQWGSASTSWTTIRAGNGTFDFKLDQDFVGNGDKRFRLVRINSSLSTKQIVAWLDALVFD